MPKSEPLKVLSCAPGIPVAARWLKPGSVSWVQKPLSFQCRIGTPWNQPRHNHGHE